MKKRFGKTNIVLVEGDITDLAIDAIVNAANSHLAHGAGVAAAIVKKGGQSIQEESDTWVFARGEVPVGEAAITSGCDLHCRYIIHAVGPRMGEGSEDEKLKQATLSSLKLAEKHSLKSIAFPAISTGIFGFPMERCARIMLSVVVDYVKGQTKLEKIVFCLFGKKAYDIFKNTFKTIR